MRISDWISDVCSSDLSSLDYADLQKDIAVAEYDKAIHPAFREVADGLAARQTFSAQFKAYQDLVDTNRRYLELADQRYRAGVESYLTVLDAQRALQIGRASCRERVCQYV